MGFFLLKNCFFKIMIIYFERWVSFLELLEKGVVDIDDDIEEEQEDINEYTKAPAYIRSGCDLCQ